MAKAIKMGSTQVEMKRETFSKKEKGILNALIEHEIPPVSALQALTVCN